MPTTLCMSWRLRAFIAPVRQRRRRGSQLFHQVGVAEQLVGQWNPLLLDLLSFGPRYQTRKIDRPIMIAWRVWTLDVTKLALKTEIDDLSHVLRLEFLGVDLGVFAFRAVIVDRIEHLRKTAAKLDTH